jgi:hypothetical protein
VTLVWSITSGKRTVIEDGKEIHFSVGRRTEGKFQHSWTGYNNHVFTVIAYASMPFKPKPGFQQFEFMIDGMSFNTFPRIFELAKGVRNSRSSRSHASVSRYEYRSDRETSRSSSNTDMQWAQNTVQLGTRRRVDVNSPISVPKPTVEPKPQDLPPPTVSLIDMEMSSSTPSLGATSFGDSYDSFNSSSQFDYNSSQPPSYETVWSSIMDAYDTNETYTSENVTAQTTETEMPDMTKLNINTDFQNTDPKERQTKLESPREVSDFDGVLQNLVNLDDISSSVLKGYTVQDSQMNQKANSTRSLSELKNIQNSRPSSGPTKEIMKTHQAYAAANPDAMVVYGQPQQSYNTYSCDVPVYGSSYGAY